MSSMCAKHHTHIYTHGRSEAVLVDLIMFLIPSIVPAHTKHTKKESRSQGCITTAHD